MIDSRRTAQLGLVMAALMAGGAHALGQAVQTPYLDAEHGITIEELVTLALQHSPDVAAAVARVDIARGNVAQAALRANPSIKVGGATEIGGPDGQIVAGVSWPLELFRRDARTDAARREADVAVFDLDGEFEVTRDALRSKSRNTPFMGHRLQGRPLFTVLGGRVID